MSSGSEVATTNCLLKQVDVTVPYAWCKEMYALYGDAFHNLLKCNFFEI